MSVFLRFMVTLVSIAIASGLSVSCADTHRDDLGAGEDVASFDWGKQPDPGPDTKTEADTFTAQDTAQPDVLSVNDVAELGDALTQEDVSTAQEDVKPDPENVPVDESCGDGLCEVGVEDCGVCLSDCPCPVGQSCEDHMCVDNGGAKGFNCDGPTSIYLQAHKGAYVVAEDGGGGAVNADRNKAGAWESFELADIDGCPLNSGDLVHLKASGSTHYLKAQDGGGGLVDATASAPGAWETFKIVKVSGQGEISPYDLIALEADNGQYVVAEGGGCGEVRADRDKIGPWETFKLYLVSDGAPDAGSVCGKVFDPAWPPHWNLSKSSDMRIAQLATEALEGLGFPKGSAEGPGPNDRLIATRYLLAWIDQTGFVGKMNGLWRLNGLAGDGLDFVVRDGNRPLNFFVVGEWGKGQFPEGYPGSEHTEFPSKALEPGDDPKCLESDWCNQYAHDEAASITDADIPWWSSCNKGQKGWDFLHLPIQEELVAGGLRIKYEAPLVKEADGDGNYDGDACHQNWLFPDGVRRPVYLQVGYEFYPDSTYFDRIVSFRNAEGNPDFTGNLCVIGGFVLSQWPNPHPLKRVNAFFMPTNQGFQDPKHGMFFDVGTWNDHQVPHEGGDEVFGWIKNPFSLSAFPFEAAGRTAAMSHIGPSDNDDAGFCLCSVHGGLEMGGGLLHGGISLPIAGGKESIQARRRLDLPGDVLEVKTWVYQAEKDLLHGTGKAEGNGWAASTGEHNPGHMVYGPYAKDWYGSQGSATFRMMVDNNDADNVDVVTIDVHDATTDTDLVQLSIKRKEFKAPFAYQDFTLSFDLKDRIGHALETRVYWHDVSFVKVDKVTVSLKP